MNSNRNQGNYIWKMIQYLQYVSKEIHMLCDVLLHLVLLFMTVKCLPQYTKLKLAAAQVNVVTNLCLTLTTLAAQ